MNKVEKITYNAYLYMLLVAQSLITICVSSIVVLHIALAHCIMRFNVCFNILFTIGDDVACRDIRKLTA